MNKALKKLKKDIASAAAKTSADAPPVLPKYKASAADLESDLFEERPETWSESIDLYGTMNGLTDDEIADLWNRIPPESRAAHGEKYMIESIDAYVQMKMEDNPDDVYDAEREPGEIRYGNITVRRQPTIRDKNVQTILLSNPEMESEIRRRMRRIYHEIKDEQLHRPATVIPRQCMMLYKRRPWIPDYDYTLISFPKKVNTKYVLANSPVERWNIPGVRDLDLYYPNMLFTLLNCNEYSDERTQKGEIFTAYDSAYKKRRFILVHVTTSGKRIVQDEALFAQEKEYITFTRAGRAALYNKMMATHIKTNLDIDRVARRVVISQLALSLGLDGPTEYVEEIEEGIYDYVDNGFTIRDYLYIAASIIVFTSTIHLGSYAHTFRKRLQEQVYNPSSVYEISDIEKFPEAFLNLNVGTEHVSAIEEIVTNSKSQIVRELGHSIYAVINPTARIATLPNVTVGVSLPTELGRRKCANKIDFDDWEIVSYNDAGTVYCFAISDLLDQFSDNNYTNKYTGKRFDDGFVTDVKNTFQKQVILPVILPKSVEVTSVRDKESVPDLIALLTTELQRLESLMDTVPPSLRPRVCAYCNTYITKTGISSLDKDANVVDFCNSECLNNF